MFLAQLMKLWPICWFALPLSPPLRGVHSSIDTLESRRGFRKLVRFGPGAISPCDLYPQKSKKQRYIAMICYYEMMQSFGYSRCVYVVLSWSKFQESWWQNTTGDNTWQYYLPQPAEHKGPQQKRLQVKNKHLKFESKACGLRSVCFLVQLWFGSLNCTAAHQIAPWCPWLQVELKGAGSCYWFLALAAGWL